MKILLVRISVHFISIADPAGHDQLLVQQLQLDRGKLIQPFCAMDNFHLDASNVHVPASCSRQTKRKITGL